MFAKWHSGDMLEALWQTVMCYLMTIIGKRRCLEDYLNQFIIAKLHCRCLIFPVILRLALVNCLIFPVILRLALVNCLIFPVILRLALVNCLIFPVILRLDLVN